MTRPNAERDNLPFTIGILHEDHEIHGFDCGMETLNQYLHKYAWNNAAMNFGVTYVMVQTGSYSVLGYYTLVAGQMVPEETFSGTRRRKLPPHNVPVVRLARLAVDTSAQGKGLGALLLIDALTHALEFSGSIGAYGVEVDAMNESVVPFYQLHGFTVLRDSPLHLFLPMQTIRTSLGH